MKRMILKTHYLATLPLLAFLLLPIGAQAQHFIEQAKQKATVKAAGDIFGRSVAISGDREIVGAPDKDNKTGEAYFFDLNTDKLNPKQPLRSVLAQQPPQEARFGNAVAISGNWAIVGAPGHREGTVPGAAYVFKFVAGAWVHEHTLQAPGHLFGFSVAISGNLAIVGAPGYDEGPGKKDIGAAYVFEIGAGTPVPVKLQPDVPRAGGVFGYAVSTNGTWAIVGAYKEEGTGAAYLFEKTQWSSPVHKLKGAGQQPGSLFGVSVSINNNWAIVGEWGGNGTGNIGAAYLYKVGGGAQHHQKLTGPTADDNFGYSVAIDDNGTQADPGDDRALVGAPGTDTGGKNAGAAYVFESAGGAWNLPPQKLQACDKELDTHFGVWVALSGYRAVAGAHREDTGGPIAGAAYLFELMSCGCSP